MILKIKNFNSYFKKIDLFGVMIPIFYFKETDHKSKFTMISSFICIISLIFITIF
jgi:hypothetical protein